MVALPLPLPLLTKLSNAHAFNSSKEARPVSLLRESMKLTFVSQVKLYLAVGLADMINLFTGKSPFLEHKSAI